MYLHVYCTAKYRKYGRSYKEWFNNCSSCVIRGPFHSSFPPSCCILVDRRRYSLLGVYCSGSHAYSLTLEKPSFLTGLCLSNDKWEILMTD